MKPAALTCIKNFLIIFLLFIISSCFHYRVLNTNNDPSTEYEKRVLRSYCWGLINDPKDFHIPNCTNSNAIDEVNFSQKFGQTLVTLVTLGIVNSVEVKWKCHKPCQPIGGGL
jgi:hypothetical protein